MLRLLAAISEFDYLTIHEAQLVFSNQTYAYKVLKELRERGLLVEFLTDATPRKAFCLTRKGYRELAEAGRLRVESWFKPDYYKQHLFRHKTACARVGMLLQKHPLIHGFKHEKLLWAERGQYTGRICDGEFWFRVPGRDRSVHVGLEVELTLKNSGKLVDKLRGLGASSRLDAVWWVCGNKTIFRALRHKIQELPWVTEGRHFLIGLDAAERAAETWELEDARGEGYKIGVDALEWPPPEPVKVAAPTAQLAGPGGALAGVSGTAEGVSRAEAGAVAVAEPPGPSEPVEGLYRWSDERTRWERSRPWLLRVGAVVVAVGLAVAGARRVSPRFEQWSDRKLAERTGWTWRLGQERFQSKRWDVRFKFLKEKGGRYRMKTVLENRGRGPCRFAAVEVRDDQGRIAVRRLFGPLVVAGGKRLAHRLDFKTFAFKRAFKVAFRTVEGDGCGDAAFALELKGRRS